MEMQMENQLLESPLFSRHQALEAVFGEESLWRVPLSYGDSIAEARQLRARAGVADVTSTGRIRIRGDGALDLLERVCTHDVARQEDDTVADTVLCNERGGILDAARLVRLADAWLLLTSPACRTRLLEHLSAQAADLDAKVDDQTLKIAQLLVAGPDAAQILDAVLPVKVSHLGPDQVQTGMVVVARYIAVRTAMAGAWGLEVIVPNMAAGMAWDYITRKAGDNNVPPVGLAALDSLRIEAGAVRYGHEVSEAIDPLTAGLGDRVAADREFIGAGALRKLRPQRRRVGLVLHVPAERIDAATLGQAVPRQGDSITDSDGSDIGSVTSGGWSARLDEPIAQALVARHVEAGAQVTVTTAGGALPAEVTDLPIIKEP
jgi:aminomethyltransferase